tara:strand:+ start:543 stop:1325 length:783 start_codon:yes stop_codon:yes gene_type:complete
MISTALVAGFLAGFFGIGGGIITVPMFYYIFQALNIESSFIMHLAIGTSFSIIVPTAVMSVFTHYKHGAVDFSIVRSYGFFVVIGVAIGTVISANLHTKSLVLFFSIALYFFALNIFFIKEKKEIKKKFTLFSKIILGLLSGFVSSLMGIGGAIMNVPVLKHLGFSINNAIGTAAAIGFLIALSGALGFFISGTYLNANLPLSLGFINIPAFLIIVPITTFMARIGANMMHKIDKNTVNKLFGFFLLIVATKFLYNYFNF